VTPTFADDVAERLESIVVDNFADPEQRTWTENGVDLKDTREWAVTGSKFVTAEFPKMAYVDSAPEALATHYPQAALADAAAKTSPSKSLGVYVKFDRKGYNYFELYPVKKDDKGNLVDAPYALPGVTKMIDLWVWGSNFRTTLEIHVRDYRGIPYVLEAGSLNFQGWRNVRVTVPASIPQTQTYLPNYEGLSLTKLVVRTEATERVDGFYTYFNQLKVLSDMHQNPFDGKDLTNPDFINKYFPSTQKVGN
jgi:hypothetical protein